MAVSSVSALEEIALANTTEEATFVLLGFGKLHNSVLAFIIILTMFITTLCGNLTIVTLVLSSRRLHTPMYMLLLHLSICDVVFTTNIVPNILLSVLKGMIRISIQKCISQFYVYGVSVVAEYLILTAMSYDRYIAICRPLHYTSIMDVGMCVKLVGLSWLAGGLITLNTVLIIFMQPFCGPNIIDHFICDIGPLFKLSCSDLFFFQVFIYVLAIPSLLTPFMFIIVTYICIFITISKITSKERKEKTFSTCSPHLTSVCLYYGSLITIYVFPNRGQEISTNKVLFLLYTVINPLFNPFIYSIRNQEIRKLLRWLFWKKKRP